MVRLAAPILAVALFAARAAQADDFVRPDCRGAVVPTASLKFDTPEHALWYRRFWTGDCAHLPFFCIPGSPNWNDVVAKLVARGGPSEQSVLLPKACRLGQLIGLEWSREKKIRRIDTRDLRVFNGILDASGDALRGVDQVETKARALTTTH